MLCVRKPLRKHACLLLPNFWKSSCVTSMFSKFDHPCYIVSVIQTASQDKVRIAVLLKWHELSYLPLYRARSLAGRCSSSCRPSSARTWEQISQGCIVLTRPFVTHCQWRREGWECGRPQNIFRGEGQTGKFVTDLPLSFCFMTTSINLPRTIRRAI
jgi:hypothetical protein